MGQNSDILRFDVQMVLDKQLLEETDNAYTTPSDTVSLQQHLENQLQSMNLEDILVQGGMPCQAFHVPDNQAPRADGDIAPGIDRRDLILAKYEDSIKNLIDEYELESPDIMVQPAMENDPSRPYKVALVGETNYVVGEGQLGPTSAARDHLAFLMHGSLDDVNAVFEQSQKAVDNLVDKLQGHIGNGMLDSDFLHFDSGDDLREVIEWIESTFGVDIQLDEELKQHDHPEVDQPFRAAPEGQDPDTSLMESTMGLIP